jgi:hypothetical protein
MMGNDIGASARAVGACRGGEGRDCSGRGESQDLKPHTGILARHATLSSGIGAAVI